MRRCGGFTLPEVLTATAIFGMVMTLVVTFFTLSQHYYNVGSQELDVQSSARYALARMAAEIQESDSAGVSINSSHDAIVFVSARNASNNFELYNGLGGSSSNCGSSPAGDSGKPCWEKWVCYHISGLNLMRAEGNPTGTSFPTTTIPSSIPPTTAFSGASVARNISTLDLESLTCGTSGAPLYLQVTAEESYGGKLTFYNPGAPVSFNGCAKSGNWVQLNFGN